MTRTRDKLALFGLLFLGAWGCGRTPAAADLQKKQLEARTAKLEADLADATARLNEAEQTTARDQARFRAAEEKLTKELARGKALERDRDERYAKLKQTATQRDTSQAQFDTLVRKLETVLGETKAAAGKPAGDDKADEAAKTSTAAAKAGD
jgi:chromosome segregation ATPase